MEDTGQCVGEIIAYEMNFQGDGFNIIIKK